MFVMPKCGLVGWCPRRESEWIRAALDNGFARRRKPKQQDGGELAGNELSILLLAMGYLRPNNRVIGSAGSSDNA